jgi:imidazolonepropionase-like amidohydrolase
MRNILSFVLMIALSSFAPLSVVALNSEEVVIKNATVLTADRGTLTGTDIRIKDGKIAEIGRNLVPAAGAKVIDATGKYVTPGIIDAHAHTMLDAINEGTFSVTSMTDVKDVLDPHDIAIYRGLAAGVTTVNLLHGSANSIGGQNATVKFKYGKPVGHFLVADAPPGIKFALGENVKRSNFNIPGQTPRYPRTRMGVMETIRDAFRRAIDYRQEWSDYRAGKTKIEPRRDLELEPLVEVLEGKRLVHAHGYRSDEHLNLIRIADEFGFKIGTLQHALESYKIAPEIAKHGAGVSIFVDYWSFKLESFDTIPFAASILWRNGVNVSINSDSDERMRRLNIDAAKVMKYGGVPEQDALRMITLNPAIQLGIEKRTGSVTVGKDADLVIWNGHPFSVYSQVETTMIEGEIYFDRQVDLARRADLQKERESLEGKDVNKPSSGGVAPRIPTERRIEDRDDADQDGGGDHK